MLVWGIFNAQWQRGGSYRLGEFKVHKALEW